jgi:Fucose permease
MAAFAMNLTAISPLLPAISKTFSLSMAKAGTLFTAEFAGFIIFILIGGYLADKFSKKLVVAISLFGIIISLVLFTTTGKFYIAMILIGFAGGFGGIIESMTTAIVSDLNDVNRSFYVNLSQVFFGLGAIIGPLVAGLMVSAGINWKLFYYYLTALLLIPTIVFTFYKVPALPKSEALSIKDMGRALKNRKFLAICLCMTFYTGSEVGGWGWLSTLLQNSLGFSIAVAGIAVAVFWAAMTVGRYLCGYLTLKFKLRSIIIALAGLSSVVTLLAVFTSSAVFVWFVIIAMGLTYSSQFPLIVDYGTENSSTSSGITVSLLMGFGALGSMFVPYFIGLVGDYAGLRYGMIIPAVLLLLVAVFFTGFGRRTV